MYGNYVQEPEPGHAVKGPVNKQPEIMLGNSVANDLLPKSTAEVSNLQELVIEDNSGTVPDVSADGDKVSTAHFSCQLCSDVKLPDSGRHITQTRSF